MPPSSTSQSYRHLLVVEDQKAKRIVTLEESTYSIGRDSNNAIVLYDHQVSRYHATLLQVTDYKNDRHFYRIIDGNLEGKKSTNGIAINGRYCLSHELKHGDLIKFGGKAQASYQVIPVTPDVDLLKSTDGGKSTQIEAPKEAFNRTLTSNGELEQLSREDLSRLASFPELSPNPIVEMDWEGNLTYLNPAASVKFKNIEQAKLEHPVLAKLLNAPHDKQGLFVREVQVGQDVFEQYVHYLQEGKLIRSYLFDFTKRKQTESQLRESEERYRAVVRQASEGIFLIDVASHRLVEANSAYCNLLGYSTKEITELTLDDIVGHQTDADLQQICEKSDRTFESLHRRQDGSLIEVEVSAGLVRYGTQELFCFVVRDITQRKLSEKTLREQTFRDLSTGLPNQTLFREQISIALDNAKSHQHLLAVLMLNIKFQEDREIERGDRLKELAERLKYCLRSADIVSRQEGNQFAVLLPQIGGLNDVTKVSKRILSKLRQPSAVDQLQVTTNIGIAVYPQDGEDADSLLKNAHTALQRINEKRNTCQFYSATENSKASALVKLETLLHQALEKKQFALHYQPQINANTGTLSGMEALLRWHHPELGQVPPGKFIPLAEETDLIIPIGKWVLQSACAQNKAWQEAGLPSVRVAVNLSPRQFQPQLPATVSQILKQTGLNPHYLEMEVSETTIQNTDLARKTLENLQHLGVRLALDNFGSGNTSINTLREFPFQTLKIDRSFIHELKDTPADIATISALITLGRGYNLRVVAEGVETQEQFDLLRRLRCEEMQGYEFSHPLTAQEATQFLSSYNAVKASANS